MALPDSDRLAERERLLDEKERALAAREKEIQDRLENMPFSKAVKEKKEDWFDKVNLSVKQLDAIILAASIALGIVVVLIILEAAGIFAL